MEAFNLGSNDGQSGLPGGGLVTTLSPEVCELRMRKCRGELRLVGYDFCGLFCLGVLS